MLEVYACVATSGKLHVAVSSNPTIDTGMAIRHVARGRWQSHTTRPRNAAKSATTMCDITQHASNTAGTHGRRPVRSVNASAATKNNPSERASVKLNSPARLLARLPP